MKNFSTIFIVLISLQIITNAQIPDTVWTRTFGGDEDDVGYSVQQTLDGGYIICGSTESFATMNRDLWLIKTDSEGIISWSKIYGSTDIDEGYSVQQTSDGGYILCGSTRSYGNYGENNIWLVKTDSAGDTLWTKTFNDIHEAVGNSVRQTPDDGYIVVGFTFDFFDVDVLLLKTDINGNLEWSKKYGSEYLDEFGSSVCINNDGGYTITGGTGFKGQAQDQNYKFDEKNYSREIESAYDLLIIKIDELGDTIWTKTYGGEDYDCGNSILQTADDGFIIVGETSYFEGDLWIVKTDNMGDTLWTKQYGKDNLYERGNSIILNGEDGYIVCGNKFIIEWIGRHPWFFGDAWLLYTDLSGDTISTISFGGSGSDEVWAINYTNDGSYIVCGSTNIIDSLKSDVWLIKGATGPNSLGEENHLMVNNYALINNYPNPFNPITKIKYSIPQFSEIVIKIFDILGNEIETIVNEEKSAGTYEITWYSENLPSGVYFYQLRADSFVETKKMILMK